MNSTIHRHLIPVTDYQVLSNPGVPISAARDRSGRHDVIDVWFEYDKRAASKDVAIYIFGTGHPTPWDSSTRASYRFLGTVVTPSGLVWHVYEGPVVEGEA